MSRKGFRSITSIDGFAPEGLPRLGKIRLGVRKKGRGNREYPEEVDHFVVPDEVAAVYGDKPKVLDVVFSDQHTHVVAPHAYKKYASFGLSCKGDGRHYSRRTINGFEEGYCPHPQDCPFALDSKGRIVCKPIMNLFVTLWKVGIGGVYQIDTSSYFSIANVYRTLKLVREQWQTIKGIPLLLMRTEQRTTYQDEAGNPKQSTHWPMTLVVPNWDQRRQALGAIGKLMPDRRKLQVDLDPAEIESDLYPKSLVQKVEQTRQIETTSASSTPSGERVDMATGEVIEGPVPRGHPSAPPPVAAGMERPEAKLPGTEPGRTFADDDRPPDECYESNGEASPGLAQFMDRHPVQQGPDISHPDFAIPGSDGEASTARSGGQDGPSDPSEDSEAGAKARRRSEAGKKAAATRARRKAERKAGDGAARPANFPDKGVGPAPNEGAKDNWGSGMEAWALEEPNPIPEEEVASWYKLTFGDAFDTFDGVPAARRGSVSAWVQQRKQEIMMGGTA